MQLSLDFQGLIAADKAVIKIHHSLEMDIQIILVLVDCVMLHWEILKLGIFSLYKNNCVEASIFIHFWRLEDVSFRYYS